jgi:putative (di)nucleoside polyphosphate hydrolase
VAEEIGTDRVVIIGETAEWLTYDLPPELAARVWGGRFRGQRQKWFALRFTGTDADIDLAAHGDPEFDSWRWVPLASLPEAIVDFKRPLYRALVAAFAAYGLISMA